jgi:hypothetical protein
VVDEDQIWREPSSDDGNGHARADGAHELEARGPADDVNDPVPDDQLVGDDENASHGPVGLSPGVSPFDAINARLGRLLPAAGRR